MPLGFSPMMGLPQPRPPVNIQALLMAVQQLRGGGMAPPPMPMPQPGPMPMAGPMPQPQPMPMQQPMAQPPQQSMGNQDVGQMILRLRQMRQGSPGAGMRPGGQGAGSSFHGPMTRNRRAMPGRRGETLPLGGS